MTIQKTERLSILRAGQHSDRNSPITVHNLNAAEDPATSQATAVAADSFVAEGYDELELYVDVTAKGSATGVNLALEWGHHAVGDDNFFPEYQPDVTTGVLTARTYHLDISGAIRFCFVVPVRGPYGRVLAWATASGSGCRLTVKATRHQRGG